MARNGSGTYSLPESAFVYDTTIDETAVNNNFSDIATALTGSMAKDGQTTASARIPFAQGIGLADGSAAAPAVNFTGDTDTGFYRIGVNNLGISIAGAKAWEWKADGDLESNGKNLNGVAAADFSGAVTFTGSIAATGATVTVADNAFTIGDNSDATKLIAFQASGITTGTTRTLTVPDASGTIPLLNAAQTFSAAQTFTDAVDLSGATTTYEAASIPTAAVQDEAITNAKMAHIATSRIKGRVTASTGDVEDLTAAQVVALLQSTGLLATARAKVANNGTITVNESIAVTSVTRTGAGVMDVVLATTMSSSDYVISAMAVNTDGFMNITAQSATGFTIRTDLANGTATDMDFFFTVHGTPA